MVVVVVEVAVVVVTGEVVAAVVVVVSIESGRLWGLGLVLVVFSGFKVNSGGACVCVACKAYTTKQASLVFFGTA